MTSLTVETPSGRLAGREANGVAVFKGVPYAQPPIGELRFQAPRPFARWSGVREAFGYGARAMQSDDAWGIAPPGLAEIGARLVEPQNESCLYLNVWSSTPFNGSRRPVMVYLHGGAFITGSGGSPMYDGTRFAREEDVVVVTLNHRLGSFGFMNLAELGGERFEASGSAGMLDIVAALEWVRNHIAAFGGDAGNVTIFGESGGGAKVSVLLAMPAANGLFHKAIVQSGPAVEMMKPTDATAMTRKVMAALGIAEPAALLDTSAQALLAAQRTALQSVASAPFSERRRVGFNPVIDGRYLPAGPFEPVAPSLSKHVPMMIGTNKDEMSLFLAGAPWLKALDEDGLVKAAQRFVGDDAERIVKAYRAARPGAAARDIVIALASDQSMRMPSLTMADRKVALGAAPVFVYLFTWETPVADGILGSTHALEIPFVFDTLEASAPFVGTSPPRALATKMRRTWARFAHTGTPNGDGLDPWPAYDPLRRATMVFGNTCDVVDDPLGAERRAWR
jgi:para-nitrobenzyl esterase